MNKKDLIKIENIDKKLDLIENELYEARRDLVLFHKK